MKSSAFHAYSNAKQKLPRSCKETSTSSFVSSQRKGSFQQPTPPQVDNGKVKVFTRIRPSFYSFDPAAEDFAIEGIEGNSLTGRSLTSLCSIVKKDRFDRQKFIFDGVFRREARQEEVYKEMGEGKVKELVQNG